TGPGEQPPIRGSRTRVKRGSAEPPSQQPPTAAKTVRSDQQVAVSKSTGSVGRVTPLSLDPTLRPGLCTLTPELALTDVVTASGAHPSGNPLGLASDPNGNIWFTDDIPPAIAVYNHRTRRVTHPTHGLRP